MNSERTKRSFLNDILGKTAINVQASPLDTPQTIFSDILNTEKEIAQETLKLFRSRYERERENWEKLFSEKEQERLHLARQLNEAQERIKTLDHHINEERQNQIKQVQSSARDLDRRRLRDEHTWEEISDEIKDYRDQSMNSQQRLLSEQERLRQLKTAFSEQQQKLKAELAEKDAEFNRLQESATQREEGWIHERSRYEENIQEFSGKLQSLERSLDEEHKQVAAQAGKTADESIGLKKISDDAAHKLNVEQESRRETERKLAEQQKLLDLLGMENEKLKNEAEQKRQDWRRLWQEEKRTWEEYKQGIIHTQDVLQHETSEKVERIVKSIDLVEQQLAQEQLLRKESQAVLKQKEQEIEKLIVRQNELVTEWKKIVDIESQSHREQQEKITAEFNRVLHKKEEDQDRLRQENVELQAALSEEKRLLAMEKQTNAYANGQLNANANDTEALRAQWDAQARQWLAKMAEEREFYEKQIRELTARHEQQLSTREKDIARLQEDIACASAASEDSKRRLEIEKVHRGSQAEKIKAYELKLKSQEENHEADGEAGTRDALK